jgi:hypothetical protein
MGSEASPGRCFAGREGERKMSKNPVVASRPWTPEEDEKLLAALGEGPTAIAEQLHRSTTAIYHRLRKLGIPSPRMRVTERTFATHPERQFVEYLRGKGWAKGTTLPTSRLTASLQKKGWIEQQFQGPKKETFYRMTEVGLAALKAPVPIQKSWANSQNVSVGELKVKEK